VTLDRGNAILNSTALNPVVKYEYIIY